MDSLITAAARALSDGDPLAALNRVALRDDAPALALRGIAMAQLGDLPRSRDLLRHALRAFGPKEPVARARCILADAEIALVSRDLGRSLDNLHTVREVLAAAGDRANAEHAGYLDARRLLLIGRVDEAENRLGTIAPEFLPAASQVGYELVAAGIAMRRVKSEPARAALRRAEIMAKATRISALSAEVETAARSFTAPAARLASEGKERQVPLETVEKLFASDTLVVDACRNVVRIGSTIIPFATRPILLTLLRILAESWPHGVPREILLERAFGARQVDEAHRARLRVEIARAREIIEPVAVLYATKTGFALQARSAARIAVISPPVESNHAEVLALLADGEAWSSSALALALNQSARTVQRALRDLAPDGKVTKIGRGRACRWVASSVPGFPTSLLLPAVGISG